MASKYHYSKTISNSYLGVSKVIKGYTPMEVNFKTDEQIRKWKEQEGKKRVREAIEDMKAQAEYDTKAALSLIEDYKGILFATTKVNDKLKWNSLKEKEPFPESLPIQSIVSAEMNVPKENKFIELFFSSVKNKRLQKETEAMERYNKLTVAYNERKNEYELKQKEQHDSIDQFKLEFEEGHGTAIEDYVHMVLERSQYPEGFDQEYELQYDPISGTIVVSYNLPSKDSVPKLIQHKYVASRKEIDVVEMKSKEFDTHYEAVLYQVCLRTIHEIFESVYIEDVKSVVFNGWVDGIDPKTGNNFRSCIVSCLAQRAEFESYNLSRLDPKECFRSMKGLSAGPLAQLAPVRPIMDIKREDARFVESQAVLDHINGSTNLAEMEWESFEHLVRELFSMIFSKDGGEVKVTQASRDGGVDAIAFDPDPIRGGKFVIQAKRYNNVVPVSAVRDLFGTMMAEGASKGILVTTSHYGNDSREFAKDKPITLIDGSNLVYMFQEYGHKVHIQLKEKLKSS